MPIKEDQTQENLDAVAAADEAAQVAADRKAERAAARAAKKAEAELGPDKDGNYGAGAYRVQCTEKCVGSLFDGSRNVRIPHAGQGDVKIAGPIPAGSWLGAQISAGLVVIVE